MGRLCREVEQLIHLHKYGPWRVVKVTMHGDHGEMWNEDTQQQACRHCGKIKVRRL